MLNSLISRVQAWQSRLQTLRSHLQAMRALGLRNAYRLGFGYTSFLLTEDRMAERKAVEMLLDAVKPVFEKAAAENGLAISWTSPDMRIDVFGTLFVADERLRQNFNAASQTFVIVSYRRPDGTGKVCKAELHIKNSFSESRIICEIPHEKNPKLKLPFRHMAQRSLDYDLSDPETRNEWMNFAWKIASVMQRDVDAGVHPPCVIRRNSLKRHPANLSPSPTPTPPG